MNAPRKTISLLVLLIALFSICAFQAEAPAVQTDAASPTPTYDPLVETPLPADPTELELGATLYWHWCMPCHGDHGQGLTDEFRGIWESDHQNCWGRGCHAGHEGDMGFPIPTVVPAIVDLSHQLSQFPSLQELADYLKATHPPQRPGILEAREYHAIALYVFTMNQRPLVEATQTATLAPSPTASPVPPPEQTPNRSQNFIPAIGLLTLVVILIFWAIKRKSTLTKHD